MDKVILPCLCNSYNLYFNLNISKHSLLILDLVMPLSAGLKSSQSIPEVVS